MTDIDEIKSRLNIVDVVGKHVTLKKAGRNFKGLCPFHNEKTPSFIVSPDRQTFKCFGCGKGGSVIDFVMEYDHVDFLEALEDLADMAGVTLTRRPTDTPEAKVKQRLYDVNHLASDYYHYVLTKHALGEKGRLYLKNRGISDKSIRTFALGYSPNSWEALRSFLRKKGYDDALLEQAGLIVQSARRDSQGSRFYDRFRGRIIFTLKDHRGNVVGFAGRVLDPHATEAKYINTPETPVYTKGNVLYGLDVTKDAIQKANEAVVMEGELDVISSFQTGIGNAVAIKGSALTEAHVRLLRRFTERLVFALDSDLAGDAAARRGIELADSAGLDMRVVALPSGKDPDDAAREHPSLLKQAIANAVPVYDYFIASSRKRFDGTTAFGKRKITDELLPIFRKIDNPIVQAHYVKKLADELAVSEESLREGMANVAKGIVLASSAGEEQAAKHALTRPEKLEIYILALLLQGKTIDLMEDLEDAGLLPEFTHPAVHRIIDHLVATLAHREGEPEGKKVFLIKDFADSLPKELIPTLDEAFLWDIADFLTDENLFAREWTRALREFERVTLKRKIRELTQTAGDDASAHKELSQAAQKLKRLEKTS